MRLECGSSHAKKRWAENLEDFEKDSVEVRPWCWEVGIPPCSWRLTLNHAGRQLSFCHWGIELSSLPWSWVVGVSTIEACGWIFRISIGRDIKHHKIKHHKTFVTELNGIRLFLHMCNCICICTVVIDLITVYNIAFYSAYLFAGRFVANIVIGSLRTVRKRCSCSPTIVSF